MKRWIIVALYQKIKDDRWIFVCPLMLTRFRFTILSVLNPLLPLWQIHKRVFFYSCTNTCLIELINHSLTKISQKDLTQHSKCSLKSNPPSLFFKLAWGMKSINCQLITYLLWWFFSNLLSSHFINFLVKVLGFQVRYLFHGKTQFKSFLLPINHEDKLADRPPTLYRVGIRTQPVKV